MKLDCEAAKVLWKQVEETNRPDVTNHILEIEIAIVEAIKNRQDTCQVMRQVLTRDELVEICRQIQGVGFKVSCTGRRSDGPHFKSNNRYESVYFHISGWAEQTPEIAQALAGR